MDIKTRFNTDDYLACLDLNNGTLSEDEKELVHKIRKVCIKHGLIATEDMENEIFFRCEGLEANNIEDNIMACIMYALVNGFNALLEEDDDGNIWEFI